MAGLQTSDSKLPAPDVPVALRLSATAIRTVFLFILVAIAVRVSLPQSETIWTAYETPADLVRFLLGIAICLWLGFLLFQGPSDSHGYRTWLYLGLFGVPFALVCLFAIW